MFVHLFELVLSAAVRPLSFILNQKLIVISLAQGMATTIFLDTISDLNVFSREIHKILRLCNCDLLSVIQ